MSLETDLVAILQAQCPRTFPGVAKFGTPMPYVIWQHIGGQSLRFLDNTTGDKRNAFIQITVWAATSLQATTLARAIEDALCAATAVLLATPQGEPVDAFDDGDELRGTVQSFSIWGDR